MNNFSALVLAFAYLIQASFAQMLTPLADGTYLQTTACESTQCTVNGTCVDQTQCAAGLGIVGIVLIIGVIAVCAKCCHHHREKIKSHMGHH